MSKRVRPASFYDDWTPPANSPPDVFARFCAQISEMTLLHADRVLHPELSSTFRGLLAELRNAQPMGSREVLRAKRERTTLLASRVKVRDIRQEVANFRSMVLRNAITPAEAFETILRDIDDLTTMLIPPLKLLKAELRSLYTALGLLAPGTNTASYEDIISDAANLDIDALAELANEETLTAVLGAIPAASAAISPTAYVGERHRRMQAGRGLTQYLFDIVGLRERDISVTETVRMIPAGMPAFKDIFLRIGRAAALVRAGMAGSARTTPEIAHDIVVAAAAVDQFATIKAAIETLYFLSRAQREATEPWRMIAERGPDIMRLYQDFSKVQGETRVTERMNMLVSRAVLICQSFNT